MDSWSSKPVVQMSSDPPLSRVNYGIGPFDANEVRILVGSTSIEQKSFIRMTPEEKRLADVLYGFGHDIQNHLKMDDIPIHSIRGLVRRKSTCYMNAVMQLLISIPPFYAFMRSLPPYQSIDPAKHPFLRTFAWMATDFTPREMMLQSKSGILFQERMALKATRKEDGEDPSGMMEGGLKQSASHRRRQRRKHGRKGVQSGGGQMSDDMYVEDGLGGIDFANDFHVGEKSRLDRKSESTPPFQSDLSWDLWVHTPITPLPLYELFQDLVRLQPFHESMIKGTQEDAHEFLGLILTKLQEECEVILSRRSREIQMEYLEEHHPGLGWERTCLIDRDGQEKYVIPKGNGSFRVLDSKEVALIESEGQSDDHSLAVRGSGDDDDGGGSEWVDVLERGRTAVVECDMNLHTTPIQALFGGVMRNLVRDVGSHQVGEEIHDSVCSSSSSHRVPFLHVSLDVFDDSVLSVQDALSHLCHRETIEMSSSKTTSSQPKSVEMQTLFDDLPAILVLHLKRFLFGMDTEKLSKPITITQDLEIPSPCLISHRTRPHNDRSYSLVGVVSHLGRFAVSGHYVADVRYGPYWMHMDDQKVSLLCTVEDEESKWDDSDAYLLVYVRK